jgi:hypothetical protein
MKKTMLVLIVLVLCIPVIALAQQTGGLPALRADLEALQTNLQNQINNLQNQINSIPAGPPGPAGPAGPPGAANGISYAVHGYVRYDGTTSPVFVEGFSVTHDETGKYTIAFLPNFLTRPNCTVSPYQARDVTQCNIDSISTRYLVYICYADDYEYNSTVEGWILKTHHLEDTSFQFICVE